MTNKSTIKDVIHQWRTLVKKRNARPTPSQLKKLVKKSPESLAAKLTISPYAHMLASPLRFCTFHNRFFPSKLLLRFSQGWHQATQLVWAYPTLRPAAGKGVYVRLSKQVLQIFSKGGYMSAFRGKATFRTDMIQHVESLLNKEALLLLTDHVSKCHRLTTTDVPHTWASNEASCQGYQCIISFDSAQSPSRELDHQVNHLQNIPCYYAHQLWNRQDIDSLFPSPPAALAVPKDATTVKLAISLWRCQNFLLS